MACGRSRAREILRPVPTVLISVLLLEWGKAPLARNHRRRTRRYSTSADPEYSSRSSRGRLADCDARSSWTLLWLAPRAERARRI